MKLLRAANDKVPAKEQDPMLLAFICRLCSSIHKLARIAVLDFNSDLWL
jgi:hypothetical protein